MQVPRFHLRTLMLAVTVIAATSAAYRIGPAPIIIVCIVVLAWHRTSDGIARGVAIRFGQRVRLGLSSLLVASVIVGLPDLAFLLGFHVYVERIADQFPVTYWNPYLEPDYLIAGVVFGAVLSLYVAVLLRTTLWPIKVPTAREDERRTLSPVRFIRQLGIALAALYVVMVGVPALLKVAFSPSDGLPWAEVVYGPAISIGSCFLLVSLGVWAEHRFRRSEPAIPKPPEDPS